MKKILLIIFLTIICCIKFTENARAYTATYGTFYDDNKGFWSAKIQKNSDWRRDFSWFWFWEFEENDGVITVSNYNTGEKYTNGQVLSGIRFFDSIYAPRVYISETGDMSILRNGAYNMEWTLFNNIDKVTLYIDLSDVQSYYDKYHEFPEVIYVGDKYKNILNDTVYYWTPSTQIQNVIEGLSPIDIGQYDPIKGWAMIIDYFAGTNLEESLKTNVDAYIIFSVYDFELDGEDINWYDISNGYYPIAKSEYADLNVCYGFDFYIAQLATIAETEKDGCYSLNFTTLYDSVDQKCDNYISKHPTPKSGEEYPCSISCRTLASQADKMCNFKDEKNKCGIGPKTMGWVMKILKVGRYIVPVLAIILGILDFITAIASSEEDALKKAQTKFIKRVVAAIIIFLLPAFLQFLFDTFKISGLDSSNPYCIK